VFFLCLTVDLCVCYYPAYGCHKKLNVCTVCCHCYKEDPLSFWYLFRPRHDICEVQLSNCIVSCANKQLVVLSSCCAGSDGSRMVADNAKALRLLLCVTGLLNKTNVSSMYGNESHGVYSGPAWLQPVSNGTGAGSWNMGDDGTTWPREFIKTKLVPTVCVFGIVGNVLTLVVLACEQLRCGAGSERKVNAWLQALAVSDLLLCIALLPHGLMTYGSRLIYTSLSPQLLYQAYGAAVINNFMLTSTWLTVAMSFGRYMAVCHPLDVHQNILLLSDCTARCGISCKTRVKAGAIFIICFVFNLPRFFEYRIDSHSCGVGPEGTEQTAFALSFGSVTGWVLGTVYVWAYFVVAIIVPLMMLAFCNVRLINTLRQSRQFRQGAQHCAIDQRRSTDRH